MYTLQWNLIIANTVKVKYLLRVNPYILNSITISYC